MAPLTIKVDVPEGAEALLESPEGIVLVIPATAPEVQEFGRNLLSGLNFTRSQAKALHVMRENFAAQGEVFANLVAALDQLLADAAEAEWLMLSACEFMNRAILTSNLEQKGTVQ